MIGIMLILVAVLGFVAVAGVGFAFAGGADAQAKANKRVQAVTGGNGKDRSRQRPMAETAVQRRKQIIDNLKATERQERKNRLSMDARLQQAGLSITVKTFWILCICLAATAALLCFVVRMNPLICMGAGFITGFGLPRWVIGMMTSRRNKRFTEDFPNAIDIIVRGIKSGLPVHDCLKVIARESPEPIASEFQRLVEGLGVGLALDQGLEKMYVRMPTAEVRFFSIVMAIQQKTGGNLAEALSNLSTVLRARKLMKEKVKAMSGEAIASAIIIGSLPPGIMMLVSITSPSYMMPMYIDSRGHLMLLAGAFWMASGIFVMRRMINFKI